MMLLILILGLGVFFVAASIVVAWGRTSSIVLNPAPGHAVTDLGVPDWIRTPPEAVRGVLDSLGFEPSHIERRGWCEIGCEARIGPRWLAIWVNREDQAYVEIEAAGQPVSELPMELTFVSLMGARRLMTSHASSFVIRELAAGARVQRPDKPGYLEQWLVHCRSWQEMTDRDATLQPTLVTPTDYASRSAAHMTDYFLELCERGDLVRIGDGYRFARWRLLHSLISRPGTAVVPKGSFRLSRNKPGASTGLELDANSLESLTSRSTPAGTEGVVLAQLQTLALKRRDAVDDICSASLGIKSLIALLSGAFCLLVFGLILPWEYALALLPILLFHELGHLWAMHVFGYANKTLFFMPLGAAVTGRKRDASTTEELIVFLAGPAPGIVIALLWMWLVPERAGFFDMFPVLMLVLNCVNLLPVMPLDGGRIVNLLIGERFPIMQFSLYGLSVVIVGLFMAFTQDVFLAILFIWLVVGLRVRWRSMQIARLLIRDERFARRREPDPTGHRRDAWLARAFSLLHKPATNFEVLRVAVNDHLAAYDRPPSSTWKNSAIALLFLGFLLGPPAVFYIHIMPAADAMQMTAVDE